MNSTDGSSDSSGQNVDQDSSKPAYTIPGILHFIQHEWSKFEIEKSQFDVERAELQAKIAFLEGERRGQENLKRDLVRRIKMLEFALRQERAKFNKHKYSDTEKESNLLENKRSSISLPYIGESSFRNHNKVSPQQSVEQLVYKQPQQVMSTPVRQGRQLLRQYLQEVGYTDTILDVRSQRVRALLNSNPVLPEGANNILNKLSDRANSMQTKNSSSPGAFITEENQENDHPNQIDKDISTIDNLFEDVNNSSNFEDIIMESNISNDNNKILESSLSDSNDENGVLAQFDFLSDEAEDKNEEGTGDLGKTNEWHYDKSKLDQKKEQFVKEKRNNKKRVSKRPLKKDLQNYLNTIQGNSSKSDQNLIIPGSSDQIDQISVDNFVSGDQDTNLPFTVGGSARINDDSIDVNSLSLGPLAGLTVSNEADALSLNMGQTSNDLLKKNYNPKYTLRSHFDGVRDLCFLPNCSGLITASEDRTLKLWNLNKSAASQYNKKSSSSQDLEPIYSFRGHMSEVLCCVVGCCSENNSYCFSGGSDATVRVWKIPPITKDPYESYDSSVSYKTLIGHTDSVWSLSFSDKVTRGSLLSASSDKSVKLWNPFSNDPLIETFNLNESCAPTCVDFVRSDKSKFVVSYEDGLICIQDIESKVPLLKLQESGTIKEDRVNSVVSHPTMPLTISAHDDKHIKFHDINSGKCIHEMVAHLDVVSSLAIDPTGAYLLSGSHDSSLRLWNLETKTCTQELTSHRKKYDESIHSVAFHPNAHFIASAGADSMVKVFE